jgi:hypothetical protein
VRKSVEVDGSSTCECERECECECECPAILCTLPSLTQGTLSTSLVWYLVRHSGNMLFFKVKPNLTSRFFHSQSPIHNRSKNALEYWPSQSACFRIQQSNYITAPKTPTLTQIAPSIHQMSFMNHHSSPAQREMSI